MTVPQPFRLAAFALLAWTVVPDAQAEVRTFGNPAYEGYRLDFCKGSGRECGERVATEWCVAQGYEYASDWGIDRDIGALQPTIRLDDSNVCHDGQCDGFSAITCGREEAAFRMPGTSANTRSTVFTPDRRQAAPTITRTEVQLSVPGCSQFEPGVLLCQTPADYQYCRSLLEQGYALGCRAELDLDGAVPGMREAISGEYELSLRGRASVSVNRRSRGDGRIRGATRYRLSFEIPEYAAGTESCIQRDRYEYRQTGPDAGLAEIFPADDCDEPLEGQFSPHEDDLVYAYDLCEGRNSWGDKIEATTDLIVAAIFHFSSPTASSADRDATASRTVSPYLAIGAPLEVVCNR